VYLLSVVAYGLLSATAQACDSGAVALFGCDAAKSRKFIELCAPAPLDAQSGYLLYRFGSLDNEGVEKSVELDIPRTAPARSSGSTPPPIRTAASYTQSVRFVSGNFAYTVFTRRGACRSSMPALQCVTAVAARHQPSCAASAALLHFRVEGARRMRSGNARWHGMREISSYLAVVCEEAASRGYSFDSSKTGACSIIRSDTGHDGANRP
jgi:hypothetical protein